MSRTYEQLEPVISALDNRISAKAEQIDALDTRVTAVEGGIGETNERLGELKSALNDGDFMVKSGHFTDAEKALDWSMSTRKIQFESETKGLLMSFTETSAGSKTVSCAFSQMTGFDETSVRFSTTVYPYVVLRTESNLPDAANSKFKFYIYNSNGTVGSEVSVAIPNGSKLIVINIPKLITESGQDGSLKTLIEPDGIRTPSYTYSEAPRCEVHFMGMFTEAEVKAYNFSVTVDSLWADIAKAETEITDIKLSGGYNLFDETKTVFGYLGTDGSINPANLTKKELASDFIQVIPGKKYTLQIWEPTTGDFWARIIYYASDKSLENYDTVSTGYALVDDYNYYKSLITIPDGITFVRISFRSYGNGKVCLEKGTVAEDWTNGIGAVLNHKAFNTADTYTLKSIQHRGSHQVAPENTMPAFIQSKNEGWHFVETDVSFTQDRVPVLLHDDTLNRTCCNASDGSAISTDLNISTLTYSQLSSYDACTPSKWDTYKGTKIPSFDDFICLCRNIDLHPYIELKTAQSPTADEIRSLVNIVKKWGMADNVTWISFSYTLLNAVHIADPYARLGLLEGSYDERVQVNGAMLKSVNNEVFIDATTSVVSSILINECITYGLPLEVYCPDTEQEMLALDSYVSGATSNVVKFSDVISGSILGS